MRKKRTIARAFKTAAGRAGDPAMKGEHCAETERERASLGWTGEALRKNLRVRASQAATALTTTESQTNYVSPKSVPSHLSLCSRRRRRRRRR